MQNNNNISDQNSSTPTPFVSFETAWAGLKPELDKEAERREKKKRRFIIFWFFMLALGLAGGGYLTFNTKQNNITNNAFNHSLKNTHIASKPQALTKNYNSPLANDSKDKTIPLSQHQAVDNTAPSAINEVVETSLNSGVINTTNSINKNDNAIKENSKKPLLSAFIINNKNKAKPNAKHSINNTLTKETKAIASISNKSNINHSNNNNSSITSDKNSNTIKAKYIINNTTNTTNEDNSTSINNIASLDNIPTTNKDSKTVDTITKKAVDSTLKPMLAAQSVSLSKKHYKTKSIHYGLQLNIPFGDGVNYKDVNGDNQPLTQLIPQVWVSKTWKEKHSLTLLVNPYSQYYLNNTAVTSRSKYNVSIHQGSKISTSPEDIVYNETVSFDKLISIEATLMYHYQLSNHIKMGVGIGNNWVQSGLMSNKVVKNNTQITRDSLFGIDKNNTEWQYINTQFILSKFEVLYQLKKFDLGMNLSTPLDNLFNDIKSYRSTVNTNVFARWTFK